MTGLFAAFWAVVLVVLIGMAMFFGTEIWPIFLWLGVGVFVREFSKEDHP